MVELIKVTRHQSLKATVINRKPLYYTKGADSLLDRPPHVRAGSSLTWFGNYLAVVQDDSNFLVLINPETFEVDSIPLPPGEDQKRNFDDLQGNKGFKLDLEACTSITTPEGDLLLAFGSGSTSRRQQILMVHESDPEGFILQAADALYNQLRECYAFSGSELNIEGAIFQEGYIRLFNRGNGAPIGDLLPVNASCDLNWPELDGYLKDPENISPPQPQNVCQYDLGSLDGLTLSFTDATVTESGIVFCGSAEDSPDATKDGAVTGSILGVFSHTPRWIELRTPNQTLFTGKVEGLCSLKTRKNRFYLVIDADNPGVACELCEVEIKGDW